MKGRRSQPVSLVAERAVRYLRERQRPVDSIRLAREILATKAPDEGTAKRVLESAFGDDPRLSYGERGWSALKVPAAPPEPDRALVVLRGGRSAKGRPFEILDVTVLRVRAGEVLEACGGSPGDRNDSDDLRESVLSALDRAVPVIHDPPGSLEALERWLGAPLGALVSLRRLGQNRCGLPAGHSLENLAERLGVSWTDSGDPLDLAAAMDSCLESLAGEDESLEDLIAAGAGDAETLDWSRFAFDRQFLRSIPHAPGTYRFYDADGDLLYVGKSKNLNARISTYFRTGGRRDERARRLVRSLHRIEVEPTGSDLEALLREAEQIRKDDPSGNVQRAIHPRRASRERLRSIMILEPAAAPWVLRAYLIRDGRLVDRVGIGPRGGGLRRIERILRDHFFSVSDGPTLAAGPDVDVETVARWLATHRDRVVAFDPTDLARPEEVSDRLRWFLAEGSPFDPDGDPIRHR